MNEPRYRVEEGRYGMLERGSHGCLAYFLLEGRYGAQWDRYLAEDLCTVGAVDWPSGVVFLKQAGGGNLFEVREYFDHWPGEEELRTRLDKLQELFSNQIQQAVQLDKTLKALRKHDERFESRNVRVNS